MGGQNPATALQPVIFDTDVLVYYLQGRPAAADFVRSVPYPLRKVSVVAYMELLQGAADQKETSAIRRDIHRNFSEIVAVDETISYQAARLIERHAVAHGLRVADALMAATALVRGMSLVTANARHFRPIRALKLKVYRP